MQSLTSDDLYAIVWTNSLVRIISTICDRLFFALPPRWRFFYFSDTPALKTHLRLLKREALLLPTVSFFRAGRGAALKTRPDGRAADRERRRNAATAKSRNNTRRGACPFISGRVSRPLRGGPKRGKRSADPGPQAWARQGRRGREGARATGDAGDGRAGDPRKPTRTTTAAEAGATPASPGRPQSPQREGRTASPHAQRRGGGAARRPRNAKRAGAAGGRATPPGRSARLGCSLPPPTGYAPQGAAAW